jgi:hypothetical protein
MLFVARNAAPFRNAASFSPGRPLLALGGGRGDLPCRDGRFSAGARAFLACWAPGQKADIVFVNLGAINWIPHNWTVNQIVHGEDATSVRHVPMTPLRILKALRRL